LTDLSNADPVLVPVPWKIAARAWALVYLGPTLVMASIFRAAEALMGGGNWASQVLAPLWGAGVFIGALGGGQRAARTTRTRRWALIIASVPPFALTNYASELAPQVDGWARFGIAVAMAALTCAVFVALTHVRSQPVGSD
jgi:hypothetical protein